MTKKLIFIFFSILLALIILLAFFGIPFFPENYSIITFLGTFFNIIFGSFVIFGIYKWKKDRENKLKDDFIANLNKIYDEIIDFKDKNKDFFFKIRIKERSFDVDIELNKNYNEISFEKSKILTDEEFKFFINSKILNLYYDLFNIIYLKREFIISDDRIKGYIYMKLISLGKLDFYIYIFIYLNFMLSNNSTIENVDLKKILKPYNFIKELNIKNY